MSIDSRRPQLIRLGLFGAASAVLYGFLFLLEENIVDLTQHGHWSFVVPISLAFLFSYFHGAFTGGFWDALGIRANDH